MNRFLSANDVNAAGKGIAAFENQSGLPPSRSRAASWGGTYPQNWYTPTIGRMRSSMGTLGLVHHQNLLTVRWQTIRACQRVSLASGKTFKKLSFKQYLLDVVSGTCMASKTKIELSNDSKTGFDRFRENKASPTCLQGITVSVFSHSGFKHLVAFNMLCEYSRSVDLLQTETDKKIETFI